MYKIYPVKKEDIAKLTKLLDSSFSIHSEDKQAPLIWKYFSNLKSFPVNAYVTKFKDEIVSFYTNKVIPIRYGSNQYQAGACLDMNTDINHRRKGLIKELSKQVYESVKQNNQPFSFGFSNSQGIKVDKNYSGYGYAVVGKFVSAYTSTFSFSKKSTKYTLDKVTTFHKEASQYPKYLQISPSTKYLQWRYVDKPGKSYEIYELIENDKFIGHIIMRSGRYQLNVIKITADITKIDFSDLLIQLKSLAREYRKPLLSFFYLKNEIWKQIFKFPNFFILNRPDYYLTVKPSQVKETEKDLILNVNNWICMGGDII